MSSLFQRLRIFTLEKPELTVSFFFGFLGPAIVIAAVPIRKSLGYEQAPPLPITYPVPSGPRTFPEGYEDL